MDLTKEAADLGHTRAQLSLSAMYLHCNRDAEDHKKGVFYSTLACGQGQGGAKHGKAAHRLGVYFRCDIGGLNKLLY